MRLSDWIEEMRVWTEVDDFDGLEQKFFQNCCYLAGDEMAEWIRLMDLQDYRRQLDRAYLQALRHVRDSGARALYFEYEPLADWRGTFYLCRDYQPESAGDDDWTCDWACRLDAAPLPAFAEVLGIDGGKMDQDPPGRGKMAYLIARTVASLGRLMTTHPVGDLAICAAYQGQDPVMRLHDPAGLPT
ncbi:MAG: hypothetical protein ACLFUJ_14010 [Phycisphaerae bacterium]